MRPFTMYVFIFALGMATTRCRPSELGATAAESAYTADLLRCVDEAETLQQSRECRVKVDAKWLLTETVTDGGVR